MYQESEFATCVHHAHNDLKRPITQPDTQEQSWNCTINKSLMGIPAGQNPDSIKALVKSVSCDCNRLQ